jgi:8-oxo-dGTP pyrophosphatase MutT (NUDIX family)
MTLLQSAALLTFNEQRQVLGVTRRGTTDNWGLPGGKVDPGETHEEAESFSTKK